jgi:hypothetical protein
VVSIAQTLNLATAVHGRAGRQVTQQCFSPCGLCARLEVPDMHCQNHAGLTP